MPELWALSSESEQLATLFVGRTVLVCLSAITRREVLKPMLTIIKRDNIILAQTLILKAAAE